MVVRYTSILLFAAAVALAAPKADVYRLALADCDDVVFGPEGDLDLACHSPMDRLPVKVRSAKEVPDIMDAYVLRVRPGTGDVVFATRIGGSSFDAALRIVVDVKGVSYITGLTKSRNFPLHFGETQGGLRGNSDAFLTKISSTGEVIYSALFGGSGDEVGNALAVGNDGTVYLGGSTSSVDFGLRQRKVGSSTGDDAFICRVQTATNTAQCVSFGGTKSEKLHVGRRYGRDRPMRRPAGWRSLFGGAIKDMRTSLHKRAQ